MIGSHDTYTYLPAKNGIINTFSEFWRCQNKTVTEQYKAGVRFFDVRVKREKTEDGRHIWRCCHGLAEFDKTFSTLKSICVYFTSTLKGSKIRLVLEKGDDEDKRIFKDEIMPLTNKYDCIDSVAYKIPWKTIYTNPKSVRIKFDNTYEEWDFINIVKEIFSSPIKNNAKEKNPKITQEMIDEPDLYFLDYCTNDF